VPCPDQSIELQDLLLYPSQLSPECRETRTSYLWNPSVVWIGNDIEQFLDTATPNRSNDPELGKMGPDRIDHRGQLTDEQMAVRCRTRPLCCSGVLVGTNRMLALATASQMASASVASFFCRLT
jgi:hypothetical protein